MTIPDEAVQAAIDAHNEAWNNNQSMDNALPAFAMRAALTAAAPFLQGVKVDSVAMPPSAMVWSSTIISLAAMAAITVWKTAFRVAVAVTDTKPARLTRQEQPKPSG